MASAEGHTASNGVNAPRSIDTVTLISILNRVKAQAAVDPLSNPILLFALDLTLRMDRGEINLGGLEAVVQRLTADAFADRAARLSTYFGETALAVNFQAIKDLLERKAHGLTFDDFNAAAFIEGSKFLDSLEYQAKLATS